MALSHESNEERHARSVPGWVRASVWITIVFLAMSVIMGMFLY